MQTLLERYARTPLGDIFADQKPVSIFDDSLSWLDLPPQDFLRYAEGVKPQAYDVPIDDPGTFRDGATFMLAQVHRIWLTLKAVDRHLPGRSDAVLLDLGAYPFAIDVAVRRFLKRNCRIVATYAQELSSEARSALDQESIELLPVNLDPRVHMEKRLPGMTDALPLGDNSVDVVLFAHVIEHLYHPIQIIQEALRVLRPGGKLIVSTDHGFLLGGLLNYIGNGEYVHEPVENTAAMVFNEWRGHVRFYSEGDLRKLLLNCGGKIVDAALQEVLYNSVPPQYFTRPTLEIPRWRARLLTEFPAYRNEVLVVAQKEKSGINPFDAREHAAEFESLQAEFESGQCHLDRSTLQDLTFGHRLLFGRWPTQAELRDFQSAPPARGVDGLVDRLLSSPEFGARPLAAKLERPGASCIVMTETPGGLRFFFSAQDTFVGFPVAVGVFEPDVSAALAVLLKEGMVCVDMGANFGFHSIRMASLVGRQGKVYSFEPEPFSYALLLKNRTENRMEDIIATFQIACGEEETEAFLRRPTNPANFGGSFVTRPSAEDAVAGITVPLRRLDSMLSRNIKVDLMKMDIEGYELFALRGARETIRAHHPVIVCEFNAYGERGPETGAQLLKELSDLGYSIVEVASFNEGKKQPFQYDGSSAVFTNLVCLPRD